MKANLMYANIAPAESMVERVALAIAERRRGRDQAAAVQSGCDINLVIDGYLPQAREEARVAIEAMREPSTADIEATGDDDGDGRVHWNYRCHVCGGATESWHKIIDAALRK